MSEPDDQFVITNLETLKILSDPTRSEILTLLGHEALTVKEISKRLKANLHKMYYHINLLEEHGLVRVVETRLVSGIVEKHYRTTARRFPLDNSLLKFGSTEHSDLLDMLLEQGLEFTKQDIARGVREGLIDLSVRPPEPNALLMNRLVGRFTPEEARRVYEKLIALMNELIEGQVTGGEDAELYTIFICMYRGGLPPSNDEP